MDVLTGGHKKRFVPAREVAAVPKQNKTLESIVGSGMTSGILFDTEASQEASAGGMDECN